MFFRRNLLLAIYKLSDIAILFCSLAWTIAIGGDQGSPFSLTDLLSARMTVLHGAAIISASLLWHIFFHLTGLYETKRFVLLSEECMDILKATSLGACVLGAISALFHHEILNSYLIPAFWASSTILTITTRIAMRLILIAARYRGRNLRHMVILGTNERAVQFAEKIRTRKEMGYNILGFVDNKCVVGAGRIELLSDLDHLSEVLDRHVVDEVIIALPIQSFFNEIRRALGLCEEQGIKVRFIADVLFDPSHARLTIEYMDDAPVFTLSMGPHDELALRIKRLMDVAISSLALVLLAPLFVLIGILIKLDTQGPILFIQERVGYNKRRFAFYKLRTMTRDAEKRQEEMEHLNEASGPVFKIKYDPRVTKIGKILRKTSMDELPQLFNVLMGDMSLVGPRPLPLRDYKRFEKNWQKRRLSMKPGITCLWQIQGRNELSFEKWIELDMEYIDHWSLFLDLKILVKTIPAVLKGTGAM